MDRLNLFETSPNLVVNLRDNSDIFVSANLITEDPDINLIGSILDEHGRMILDEHGNPILRG